MHTRDADGQTRTDSRSRIVSGPEPRSVSPDPPSARVGMLSTCHTAHENSKAVRRGERRPCRLASCVGPLPESGQVSRSLAPLRSRTVMLKLLLCSVCCSFSNGHPNLRASRIPDADHHLRRSFLNCCASCSRLDTGSKCVARCALQLLSWPSAAEVFRYFYPSSFGERNSSQFRLPGCNESSRHERGGAHWYAGDLIWDPLPGQLCLWSNMPFSKIGAFVLFMRALRVTHASSRVVAWVDCHCCTTPTLAFG